MLILEPVQGALQGDLVPDHNVTDGPCLWFTSGWQNVTFIFLSGWQKKIVVVYHNITDEGGEANLARSMYSRGSSSLIDSNLTTYHFTDQGGWSTTRENQATPK